MLENTSVLGEEYAMRSTEGNNVKIRMGLFIQGLVRSWYMILFYLKCDRKQLNKPK